MARARAVAHVHSDWSYDGSWSLPALARAFERRGQAVLLMAEHDRGFDDARWRRYRAACAEASTDRITLVPGIEYSDPDDVVHVAVWGDLPFLGEGLPTATLLRRSATAGGVAVLAHPRRRGAWRRVEPGWLETLRGVELWNRKYDGYAPSDTAAALLRGHESLTAFVGLDFHTARQFHPLEMQLELDGPVSEAAVWAALRQGRCSPRAMGLPALRMTHGPPATALRGAERARRAVAVRRRHRRAGSYS